MDQNVKELKLQIRGNEAVLGGTYANNVMVHMNREEFVVDFINVIPPHATLTNRVVLSPGHFKRMIQVMQQSLERFEKEFGALPTTPPPTPPAGFVQ